MSTRNDEKRWTIETPEVIALVLTGITFSIGIAAWLDCHRERSQ